MPRPAKKPATPAKEPSPPSREGITLRDLLIWGGSGSAAMMAMLVLIVYVFIPLRNVMNSDAPPWLGVERFLPVKNEQIRFMLRLEQFDAAQKLRDICEMKRTYDALVDRRATIELRLIMTPGDEIANYTLTQIVMPRLEALQRSLLGADISRC